MTDAEHLAERPVHQLSGGERQRVAIAMALAQQTPVILLDEPTASLDLAYQPTIMRLLRELAAEGRTMITAVHDLTLAGQFCDQVALVSEGRVVACGPPEATLTTAAIRQVYDADTLVLEHPETGKPIVVAR
jgi:iron complex transport system ATP-binding protein